MRLDAASDQDNSGATGASKQRFAAHSAALGIWLLAALVPACTEVPATLTPPWESLLHRPSLRNEAGHPISL